MPKPLTREQRQALDLATNVCGAMNEAIHEIAKNVGRDGAPASPPAGTPAPPPEGGEAGEPPTQSSDDGTEPPTVIWG